MRNQLKNIKKKGKMTKTELKKFLKKIDELVVEMEKEQEIKREIAKLNQKETKKQLDIIFKSWCNDYINMTDEEVKQEEAENEKARSWEISQ